MHSKIAIHEAGHIVAHVRLGIEQSGASIIASERNAGHVTARGAEHVVSSAEAGDMILAYLGGWAALSAFGFSDKDARLGAKTDFEQAEHLCQKWALGSFSAWEDRTIAMMNEPKNKAAVERVALELDRRGHLREEILPVLVEVADQVSTEEDLQRLVAILESLG